MPVQMIELEEVQMVETSDESLEATGGIYIKHSAFNTYCYCWGV